MTRNPSDRCQLRLKTDSLNIPILSSGTNNVSLKCKGVCYQKVTREQQRKIKYLIINKTRLFCAQYILYCFLLSFLDKWSKHCNKAQYDAVAVCPLQATFGPHLGQIIIKSWPEATPLEMRRLWCVRMSVTQNIGTCLWQTCICTFQENMGDKMNLFRAAQLLIKILSKLQSYCLKIKMMNSSSYCSSAVTG